MGADRKREVKIMLERIRAHAADGWRVSDHPRSGHWVVYPPLPPGARGFVCTIPSTPSDHRSMANTRTKLHRAGWPKDWPL